MSYFSWIFTMDNTNLEGGIRKPKLSKTSSSTKSPSKGNTQVKSKSKSPKPKMDKANQEAMKVWAEKGPEEAVKHMFTKKNGESMSYAQMRMRYG